MRRRRCLTLLAASVAGAAGCVSGDPSDSDGSGPGGTDPTDDSPGTAGSTGDSDRSLGSDPAGFPPGEDDVDRVVWAADVEDPAGVVALAVDVGSATLPDARATFTLHNRSDRRFATNFYDWQIYRREGGRWHHVAPRFVNQPLTPLAPGDSHAWTVDLSSEIPAGTVPAPGDTDSIAVRPVGGGTYAFAISGWYPDQTATPTHEHQEVHAARFDLEGPQLTLEPSNAVQSVERDGGVVRLAAAGDGGSEARAATYVLRRAPEASDPDPLITEQAYRRWPLRDALAYAEEGVDEVRLRARDSEHPPFDVDTDDPTAFAYDGTTWLETVEDVADA